MTRKLTNAFGKVFFTLEVEHANRWIHIRWEGYLSESNVKAGAMALEETIRQTGYGCVLNNMLKVLGPIRSSEWAAREWAPQVAKAGLTHMALLNAPEAMAVTDVTKFHEEQAFFHTEVLADEQVARAWLQQFCQQHAA